MGRFLDDLAKSIAMQAAIEASRKKNGKIDPWKAGGIAAGMGHGSFEDTLMMGAMLGSQGAFDDDDELPEDRDVFDLFGDGSEDPDDDGEFRDEDDSDDDGAPREDGGVFDLFGDGSEDF